ncbi:MAG: DNA mismatch endonuclease Vsr [Spirochaetales bacterium]|nr:DNA mismatch endonuclease Vsr [Spirochaetales bacterium]
MARTPEEKRSYNMSRIRGKDTKPELRVRRYLFSRGLRFRKNDKRYPGKPDIVLPKYGTVIFVNGCFWHAHENCEKFVMPKTNTDFWLPKLERNRQKDQQNTLRLTEQGWSVITVWECQITGPDGERILAELYSEIVSAHNTVNNDSLNSPDGKEQTCK